MTKHRRSVTGTGALVAGAVLASSAALTNAAEAQQSLPDFLFKSPNATLGVRFGFASPRAQSEIFDFTREQLTLSALDGASFGAQLGIRATDRVEIALDVSTARSETRSEFRDWVDADDRPIEQTTRFVRVPLTLSAKVYLMDRGHSVSRFAWIPSPWAPYVGAGGGMMWYVFEQHGDWVDSFEYEDGTRDIFTDTFSSDGRSGTAHLFAGLDVSLGPRFLLNTEGRYLWARAPMDSEDFVGFDDIDLSGLQLTAGISVRF